MGTWSDGTPVAEAQIVTDPGRRRRSSRLMYLRFQRRACSSQLSWKSAARLPIEPDHSSIAGDLPTRVSAT